MTLILLGLARESREGKMVIGGLVLNHNIRVDSRDSRAVVTL